MKDWTKANKLLREKNIQIAKERGRDELKDDNKESIKLNVKASQIKKKIRRMKKCKVKVNLS
jgi:hypothetical protein